MLDVEFIFPPLSVSERYGSRNIGKGHEGHLPPLGLASLAAYLIDKKYRVDIIDALANELTDNEIIEKISQDNPKAIGFSALTSMFHRAVITAEKLKKKFPEKLIIMGGHHATIMPKEAMQKHRCFDILVYGEGELTFAEIMQKFKEAKYNTKKFLNDYKTLGKIKGILFKKKGKIIINSPREHIQNLDSLPFPARHLLPIEKYVPLPNQYLRLPVVHMVAIRGCPFNCTFCSNNAVFGRMIRAKSPARVIEEIKHVIEKYGAKEISFWDDTMTVKRDWMEEFCNLIIENGIDITWTCYARVDTVDLPLLKLMKKAGCWNIFYGFESGNQQLLDNIGKRITLQQIRNAAKWTKEAGIEIRASFMIALPGETPELAEQTLEFAKELNPDYVQFCITTPYPGTALYNDAKKYGKLTKDFDKFHGWDAVFVPKGYKNKQEILQMEKRMFKEFYLRPAYVLGRFAKIKSFRDLMRYAKGARFLLGFTS